MALNLTYVCGILLIVLKIFTTKIQISLFSQSLMTSKLGEKKKKKRGTLPLYSKRSVQTFSPIFFFNSIFSSLPRKSGLKLPNFSLQPGTLPA